MSIRIASPPKCTSPAKRRIASWNSLQPALRTISCSLNRIYRLGESFGLGQFRILCSIEVTRY
jgi:hypothetical protein